MALLYVYESNVPFLQSRQSPGFTALLLCCMSLTWQAFCNVSTTTVLQIHDLYVCTQALDEYNENNAVMDLVLFEDAMRHVARITRIISSPRCVPSPSNQQHMDQNDRVINSLNHREAHLPMLLMSLPLL
jgi:hypothetical protein